MSAVPLPAEVWLPGPLRVEVRLGARETGGSHCLLIDHPPPGWTLPAHRHANESETILVEAGRFEMVIDGVRSELGPGDLRHVPRGVEHAGRALGDAPGRRTIVFAPAGIERFFLVAGTEQPEPEPDLARLLAAAERHGWRF